MDGYLVVLRTTIGHNLILVKRQASKVLYDRIIVTLKVFPSFSEYLMIKYIP